MKTKNITIVLLALVIAIEAMQNSFANKEIATTTTGHWEWTEDADEMKSEAATLTQTDPNALNACWKVSYGRGVGTPIDSCRSGTEKNGALCYPLCSPGFNGIGPVCWEVCPSGFSDHHAFCQKGAPYGRGVGYPLWDEGRCRNENSQGCEMNGLIWYPKCAPGFHNVGCCICSPNCPPGMVDVGPDCVKRSYGRGVGEIMGCASHMQPDSGLCYHSCQSEFNGVGPVCWKGCPPSKPHECGAMCTNDLNACGNRIKEVIVSSLQAAASFANKDPTGIASALNAATQLVLPLCPSN